MRMRVILSLLIALTACVASFGLPYATASAKKQPAQKDTAAVHQSPGERVFESNCSRCHYAPDQLPHSITGTVIRHMRVRANLSAADEKALLHYLAP